MKTNAAGDLVLTTKTGPLELHQPVAYQEKNGVRQPVDVRFVVSGKHVSFALGFYDKNRQLVIDPTVTYSTYFGGDFADYGSAIAVDANGNAFVAGATDSDKIPGDSGGTNNQSFDVFVTEISSSAASSSPHCLEGVPTSFRVESQSTALATYTFPARQIPVTSQLPPVLSKEPSSAAPRAETTTPLP